MTYFKPFTDKDIKSFKYLPMNPDPVEAPLTGGPAAYYDFPPSAVTLNDLIEYKGKKDWDGQDAFHLGNILKAAWRFGIKSGTSKAYDSRKFIYSGCRLLMMYAGVDELRKTLQTILDDPQFKDR